MRKKSEIIADHIFGDMDMHRVSAPRLLKQHQGVRHLQRRYPAKSLPGEICRLEVTTSDDLLIGNVQIWYSCDEWKTQNCKEFFKGELIWDTLHWGWLRHWWVDLPPMDEGTMLRYKVGARTAAAGNWIFADNQVDNFDLGTHFAIYYGSDFLPDWSRHARVYQVFVDRFNPGESQDWLQQADIMQPCGGTLRGVIEELDHVRGLGFNTIWLSPIFTSPSHHGYDTSNYLQVNPRLGSEADFDELVIQTHQRGMRLLLDFVANHCSDQLPQFQDAKDHQDSPFHDWFTWKHWPDEYKCFYDVKSMPEFDLGYGQPARGFMLDCARYWLARGVDGFRLDYAHGPTQDFWVDFRRTCRQVNPNCWLFGEIVQPADSTARFAGSLDGSLDFHLCRAIRLTFAQQTWSLSRLAGFLEAHAAYFDADFSQPSFIDNHDMNRFLVPAHGDQRLLKIALMFLYFMPQPPVVYYGTEIAMSQRRSIHGAEGLGFDEARLPMDWQIDCPMQGILGQLAQIRETYPVILGGKVKVVLWDDQRQVLILQTGEGRSAVYLLINRSEELHKLYLGPETQTRYFDGLTGKEYVELANGLSVDLEGFQACILIPR